MTLDAVTIREARWLEDVELVRLLFREYAAELDIDFCFQGFEEELAGLPGRYAPPGGAILLPFSATGARSEPVGCVALRALDDSTCEMKRMYVRPAARGAGVGRRLADAIIERGRQIGYARMRLDTLSTMTPAITLYRSLGFVEIPAYYANPIANVVYFELRL